MLGTGWYNLYISGHAVYLRDEKSNLVYLMYPTLNPINQKLFVLKNEQSFPKWMNFPAEWDNYIKNVLRLGQIKQLFHQHAAHAATFSQLWCVYLSKQAGAVLTRCLASFAKHAWTIVSELLVILLS